MTQARILSIALLFLCSVLLLRTFSASHQYATVNAAATTTPDYIHARLNVPQLPGHELFCHSDPGVTIHNSELLKEPSRYACFGQCKNNTNVSFRDAAVEAPKMLSLCLLNPFHGFYDCVWPLVHYLSSCRPDLPLVVVNNASIPVRRQKRWAVLARETFLKQSGVAGDIIELGSLREEECICFHSLVKFDRTAFWRPIRYHYRQDIGNSKVLAPHPTVLKRNALRLFRKSIHNFYAEGDGPPENVSRLLVYGRQDAPRRRWLNVDDFVRRLSTRLPPEFNVTDINSVPQTFEQQFLLHDRADILIAPHGAAMVNTLFMHEGSTVVEIASRHCIDLTLAENTTDLDIAMDPTDPNTWVPWHAQSLGLYHLTVPCFLPTGITRNGDFVTDNENLVNLTLFALTFPRKVP